MPDVLAEAEIAALLNAAEAFIPASEKAAETVGSLQEQIDELLLVGGPSPATTHKRFAEKVDGSRIERCGCGAELGLPAPEAGGSTEVWRCVACGTVFVSGPTEGVAKPANVEKALNEAQTPLGKLSGSNPEAREELVRTLTGASFLGPERRESPRFALSLPATGVPIDARGRVAGRAVRVTTRDLSASGASVFTEAPVAAPTLLIDFTAAGYPGRQVALTITRQRVTGFLQELAGVYAGG
ncbi:MAG: PilZ domain-containing protein [Planctomycetota bacterium]